MDARSVSTSTPSGTNSGRQPARQYLAEHHAQRAFRGGIRPAAGFGAIEEAFSRPLDQRRAHVAFPAIGREDSGAQRFIDQGGGASEVVGRPRRLPDGQQQGAAQAGDQSMSRHRASPTRAHRDPPAGPRLRQIIAMPPFTCSVWPVT
ncbi:hypothetical protein HNP60_002078 [Sphingobium sp. B1D3A]|uniref:Uncharacterized protein n=1 Tax=Sphingobium lignivorans TaxID=2735886 RepID=A0ABR6NFP0_9SPHN|nr:hypothetical protein [Sphingobium lignivorans]